MADVGVLLRRHRRAAGLSIEALSEASGVSVRAIGDMERGRARGPQARTTAALADALCLVDAARAELLTAARDGRMRRVADPPELCRLPPDVPDFVGRGPELAVLDRLRSRDTRSPLVVLSGAGGLGKSTLAVHAAHRVGNGHTGGEGYPGGVLHLDLHGLDRVALDPVDALGRLIGALGVRELPGDLADRSSLYRRLLAENDVLVVLDNARAEAQVRPLLAGDGHSTVLVTSRRLLTGLSHARRLSLDPLPDDAAATLLAQVADVPGDSPHLQAVAGLCGNYPLALRIAGNRLVTRPTWSLPDLAARLADGERRLAQLVAGDLRVSAALDLSYEQLDEDARRVFHRLALVPGAGAGPEIAGVLAGLPASRAEHLLDELVELSLLVPLPGGRVGFHDLVADYAAGRGATDDDAADREAAGAALRDWLLATAGAAGRLFEPEPGPPRDGGGLTFADLDAAERWLVAEADNWLAALREAADAGADQLVVDVAEAMHWFSDRWYVWRSWIDVFELSSAAAARLADDRLEAVHRNYLVWALATHRRLPEAREAAERAGDLARAAGDRAQEAWAHNYLADLLRLGGDGAAAVSHYRAAVELFDLLPDRAGALTAVSGTGDVLCDLGRVAEGQAAFTDVLARADDPELTLPDHIRDRYRLDALLGLARTRQLTGDLAGAETALRSALEVAPAVGAVLVGHTGELLAQVLRDQGRPELQRAALAAARAAWLQAGAPAHVTRLDEELARLGR
ncbi:ATP-binding protein [Modestobacter lacusdianchii]